MKADTMNDKTIELPHKAPHAALQDALFVYAVGSDGAGADLIRGWPALVERVVTDVAGGPWEELLCDLDDWSNDGDNIPFRYSVNFEDGYMAIYRVSEGRSRAASEPGEVARLAEERRDAARLRALLRNNGREFDLSNPDRTTAKSLRLTLDCEGCEQYRPDGAVDFAATIRAVLDDEIRLAALNGQLEERP